jgi:hypothetical protein
MTTPPSTLQQRQPTPSRPKCLSLQYFADASNDILRTRVDDVLKTMALVEALYQSNEHSATPIPK